LEVGEESGLEGSRTERKRVIEYVRVRHLGWRCLDWMGREVDATAVTSVQCQIAEPKSRNLLFASPATKDPIHEPKGYGSLLFGETRSMYTALYDVDV
jgi:hypothetical protein